MRSVRPAPHPLWKLAVAVGAALLAPLLAGAGLDALLGHAPWMLFVGGCIGILTGTIVVVRTMARRIAALSEPTRPGETGVGTSWGEEDRA